MRKLIYMTIFLILSLPITASASIFCSYEDKAYLKRLASNINVSYDYIEVNGDVNFSITFTNIPNGFSILEGDKVIVAKTYNGGLKEAKVDGFLNGTSHQFNVYSDTIDCSDEILSTIYVTFPTYNYFYKEDVCKGIENYNLCTKWSNHSLSKDKFIETVNNYKESLKKEDIKEEEKTKKTFFLLDFYLKYYYVILPVVILISGFIMYKKSEEDTFF